MTGPAQDLSSTAAIATPRGDRWIKQLSSHLGRTRQVVVLEDGSSVLLFDPGSCAMASDGTTLRFTASAPDEATLARVEQVVGGHFDRFAASEGLRAHWIRHS